MTKQGNKVKWTARYVSRLPNAAFALVKRAGKAGMGDTTPRPLRMFHHHDKTAMKTTDLDSVSLPHLRNALVLVDQPGELSVAERNRARKHLMTHARELLAREEVWDGALYTVVKMHELAEEGADVGKRIASLTMALAGKVVGFNDIQYAILGDIYRDFTETELVTGIDGWDGTPYAYTRDNPIYMVVDVFPDWVLLESYDEVDSEWKLWRLAYSVADDEEVIAGWDAIVEVRRQVEYIPKMQGKAFYNYKGEDGRWYWVAMSGSSFVDRDLEIISNASFKAAIELADEEGKRGELDIYHVANTDVGDCLAMCMVGNFLVEAGVWHDTDLAIAARKWTEEHAEDMGVSIMFAYDPGQKVRSVYYGPIEIVKRSILLRDDAACPWSGFWNTTETEVASMGTIKDVEGVVGVDLAAQVEAAAKGTSDELVGAKVMFKEVAPAAPVAETTEPVVEVEVEKAVEVEATEPAAATEVVEPEVEAAKAADEPAVEPEVEVEKVEGVVEEMELQAEPMELVLPDETLKAIGDAAMLGVADKLVEALAPLVTAMEGIVAATAGIAELAKSAAALEAGMDELLQDDESKTAQALLGRSKAMLRPPATRPTSRIAALKEAQEGEIDDPDAEATEAAKIAGDAKVGIPALHRLKNAGLGGSMQSIQDERV